MRPAVWPTFADAAPHRMVHGAQRCRGTSGTTGRTARAPYQTTQGALLCLSVVLGMRPASTRASCTSLVAATWLQRPPRVHNGTIHPFIRKLHFVHQCRQEAGLRGFCLTWPLSHSILTLLSSSRMSWQTLATVCHDASALPKIVSPIQERAILGYLPHHPLSGA